MDLLERLIFFAIGGAFGFILGFVVARLRVIEMKVDDVKEEIHEVDEIVKQRRDERGSLRVPSFASMMLVLVLGITVFAAFSTSRTNQALDDTVACLTDFNTNQNDALTARDEAIKIAADAEVDLWTLYEALYDEAKQPDISAKQLAKLQDRLAEAISEYRDNLVAVQQVRDQYDYDDPDILQDCERKQDE